MAQATSQIVGNNQSGKRPTGLDTAYFDMESRILDLMAMADISFQQVNGVSDEIEFKNGVPAKLKELTGRDVNNALFSVRHVLDMTRQLLDDFYERGGYDTRKRSN